MFNAEIAGSKSPGKMYPGIYLPSISWYIGIACMVCYLES